jgi:hypothetical protein
MLHVIRRKVIIKIKPRHCDSLHCCCTSSLGKSGEGWLRKTRVSKYRIHINKCLDL